SGVDERASAAERFGAALRELYEAAGSPTRAALVRWGAGQQPPLRFNEKTLSDWLSSEKVVVPANERMVLALVGHLQAAAGRTAYRRPPGWWAALRRAAWAETHSNRGGRPPKPRPAPQEAAAPRLPGPRLPAVWNIPGRLLYFAGRDDLLDRVRDILQRPA